MTFGEYYSSKNTQSMESILDQAHDKILSSFTRKVSRSDCDKLERYFNDLFYPSEQSPTVIANATAIGQMISKAYEDKYNTAVNNFNIGSSNVTYGATVSELPQLIRDKFTSFNHTEKIYISTIEARLNSIKEELGKVKNTQDLAGMEVKLRQLENMLQELLKYKTSDNTGSDAKGSFLKIKGNDSIVASVRQADELYQSISKIGGVFSPVDYGQVLEWTLQAFSNQSDNIIDQNVDHLIEEQFIKGIMKTSGSELTGKGVVNSKLGPITLDGKYVRKVSDTDTQFSIGSGKGNFQFKAIQGFNPNSQRQGKMDVLFEFNDEGQIIPFRISAKNWIHLNRDLGTTNVAYALIRSLDMDSALLYSYTLQDERSEKISERAIAHKIAKYAILADILMGYSQTENYADTLFLNLREEKRVVVFSISDIIDRINNNLNAFEIDGYSSADIYGKLVKIRKALSYNDRSREFESLSLKYLQATQVRLQYTNIAKYVK